MPADTWEIFTDGGSRGNPGPSACAFVIPGIHQQGFYLDLGTNNNAEYMGVLHALKYINSLDSKPTTFNFYLDSELVVNQLTGRYRIKDLNLRNLNFEIKKLIENLKLKIVNFNHIPRSQNSAADLLVNQTLDTYFIFT